MVTVRFSLTAVSASFSSLVVAGSESYIRTGSESHLVRAGCGVRGSSGSRGGR